MRHWMQWLVVFTVLSVTLFGCSSKDAPTPGADKTAAKTPTQPTSPDKNVASDKVAKGDTKTQPASSPAAKPQCMKDKGCPPFKAIPKCAADIKPRPLKDALDNRNPLIGQTVSLIGPLKSTAGCTELACPPELGCCNQCSGGLHIGPDSGSGSGSAYDNLTLVNTKDPKDFACNGDDSLICCTHDAKGQQVVATGKIATKNGNFSIEDPILCLP